MKIQDLYKTVTDNIVAELEKGAIPWFKEWKGESLIPHNAITLRPYSGINIPILWYGMQRHGYEHHKWCTYQQACAAHAQVRGGEKGTQVVFAKSYTKHGGESEDAEQRRVLKTFTVFNISQLDGYYLPSVEPIPPEKRHAAADRIITSTGAVIHFGGNRANYSRETDIVRIPHPKDFVSTESYYSTLFHELGHWTAKRVDRELGGRFGSESYAAEELVAELTSAFLCAHLGIQGELRHGGYISSWIQLLKNDERALFSAASQASKAADYIYGVSQSPSQ